MTTIRKTLAAATLVLASGCARLEDPALVVPQAIEALELSTEIACTEPLGPDARARCEVLRVQLSSAKACSSAWLDAWDR